MNFSNFDISKNDSLYILKMDVLVEHIIKIEYEVYYNFSYNNYTKLDLEVCKGIKIDILKISFIKRNIVIKVVVYIMIYAIH